MFYHSASEVGVVGGGGGGLCGSCHLERKGTVSGAALRRKSTAQPATRVAVTEL